METVKTNEAPPPQKERSGCSQSAPAACSADWRWTLTVGRLTGNYATNMELIEVLAAMIASGAKTMTVERGERNPPNAAICREGDQQP